ncbi:MAG: methyltransferase domain-containing protein [Candidatus Staskawiczbacteria bacterium]|nr:methyltransferase domain-containing protein [Candidatus Staskawiczbacteria bacterium]MBI3337256.1 methyltransferase domain-containing protein [Candidatus Staskawiczbacteria bacterium]
MSKNTFQEKIWSEKFGKEYVARNMLNIASENELYKKNYGITRMKMDEEFIGKLNRSMKILEVGSNIGIQLVLLQKMGFRHLYGIEINKDVAELAKSRTKNINIIYGSAFDIPFKDNYFDLVFTSGVLIHISPLHIQKAMKEIYRCSKKYVWGFEYYADKYTDIEYRGRKNMLWKTNFVKLYLNYFKDLALQKESRYKHLKSDNIDTMFLLKKNSGKKK